MKNTFILFFAFILAICNNSKLFAQDSLVIYELEYINDYYPEDTGESRFYVGIKFKINHPEKTKKLFIELGNRTDSISIIKGDYEILFKDGKYGFWLFKDFITVWDKRVNVLYDVSKNDLKNSNWLAVYAEDKDGKLSEKKYLECDFKYQLNK